MSHNYYDILECNPNDTIHTIRKKYLRLALKYHPDKYPDNGTKFKEISEAYQSLTNQDISQNEKNISPIDMFKEIVSKYDNDLADILYDNFYNIIPSSINRTDWLKRIIDIPKYELINSGANIIKQYFDRKCKYDGHSTYDLKIKYDDLKEENNIKCSFDFLSRYSNINLLIDDEFITKFDLKYSNISIKFRGNIYEFNFIDDFENELKRINTYDVLLNISGVSIKYMNKNIGINHKYVKHIIVNLKCTSDIYVFKNRGIWNPKLNNRGDMYIYISYISEERDLDIIGEIEENDAHPDKIISIYDIFNL